MDIPKDLQPVLEKYAPLDTEHFMNNPSEYLSVAQVSSICNEDFLAAIGWETEELGLVKRVLKRVQRKVLNGFTIVRYESNKKNSFFSFPVEIENSRAVTVVGIAPTTDTIYLRAPYSLLAARLIPAKDPMIETRLWQGMTKVRHGHAVGYDRETEIDVLSKMLGLFR